MRLTTSRAAMTARVGAPSQDTRCPSGSINDRSRSTPLSQLASSRKSPVSAEETIEIFAFMEAADESKRQGGAPVSLASVMAKAKAEAASKLSK